MSIENIKKNSRRFFGIALFSGIMAFTDLTAAADLGLACEDLGSAARQGMTPHARWHANAGDPNAVALNHGDFSQDLDVGGQYAYFPETQIAQSDDSLSRELRTGGAYVTSAHRVNQDGVDSCSVVGVIFPENSKDPAVLDNEYTIPNITFKLIIPLDWNNESNKKLIQFGGGLFNGVVHNPGATQKFNFFSDLNPPIANGYALLASDSGHRGPVYSLSFVKTPTNGFSVVDQVAVKNFAGEHIKRVRDVGVAIINQLTGAAKPARTYFVGISTGGREALKAISQFASDFDGAIAVAPAWDVTAGQATGYKCDRLGDISLLLYNFPGRSAIEKINNFCQLVDAAAQPAVSLQNFEEAGGKLLIVQGSEDNIVPSSKTEYYWNQLRELNSNLDSFSRFYIISGFDHGRGYVPSFDLIKTLDRWVADDEKTPEAQGLHFKYANGNNIFSRLFGWSYPVSQWQETKKACAYPLKQSIDDIYSWNWYESMGCK